MKHYAVEVTDGNGSWFFHCDAEDEDHAREQALGEESVKEVLAVECQSTDEQPAYEEDVIQNDKDDCFYYLGRRIAETEEELVEWMRKENYFPNVWVEEERGGYHLYEFQNPEALGTDPELEYGVEEDDEEDDYNPDAMAESFVNGNRLSVVNHVLNHDAPATLALDIFMRLEDVDRLVFRNLMARQEGEVRP